MRRNDEVSKQSKPNKHLRTMIKERASWVSYLTVHRL